MSYILKNNPLDNGAYINQTWDNSEIPEGYIVIPSALESKWIQYAPFVSLSFDIDGNILDISDNQNARAAQNPSISEVQISRISELSAECNSSILSGFNSNCLGTIKHFDCELTDQSTIQGLVITAMMVLNGLSTESLKWKGTGELFCYEFTPQQIITLGIDMKRHVEENIDHFNDIRATVLNASTISDVLKIMW